MDLTRFAGNTNEEEKTCDLRTNPLQGGGDGGRRPSSKPITTTMARRIQGDWNSATDDRDTLLYVFKKSHNLV